MYQGWVKILFITLVHSKSVSVCNMQFVTQCMLSSSVRKEVVILISFTKVPSLKEVNFGKVKLWAVEHFWTDLYLRKRRDNKMDQISD